jgi:hypothetical protein
MVIREEPLHRVPAVHSLLSRGLAPVVRARSILLVPTLFAAAASSVAAPPRNVDPAQPLDITFPAGDACPDFPLQVRSNGPAPQVNKEFFDSNGNVVRMLSAGKGWDLTFTNVETGASLSVKGNGSVSHTSVGAGGVLTVMSSGHNGLIMFPTDVPAGPTTTLYSGRIVYTVDPSNAFLTTVLQESGKSTDVCAVLG